MKKRKITVREFMNQLGKERRLFVNLIVTDTVDLSLFDFESNAILRLNNIRIEGDLSFGNDGPAGLYLRNVAVKGEVFCGNNVVLWLQCFSHFGPKGTPVHVNHQAIERLLEYLQPMRIPHRGD